MKINKLVLAVIITVVFLLGFILGFGTKTNNSQGGRGSIDINPLPSSCQYGGKVYESGESFPAEDGCNSCSCEDGVVNCTLKACD